MAYTVISQHTYKDKKLQYVTMVNTVESFGNVISDVQDYISQMNSDTSFPYVSTYASIRSFTANDVRQFGIGRPELIDPNDDRYKGGYVINFILSLQDRP